ncbi:ATP-binding protein [Desulfotignum phosphitoxidans]|uniref:histidine kinase n=1 Tax=Desulfotignum phosphitoxidans DSM 13687 TaxID=1286635 RepID=S0FV06_9BACT|nr:ATP-binding protein [Desulfotignum phosphitoxidans]EMS78933.1 blue-light-activated protein [Desulfotignum phosphitoxidans DSM 13687]
MNIHSHLLGDLLVGMGTITQVQLDEALQTQQHFFEDTFQLEMDRTELVSGSRKKNVSPPPKLGQILMEKGYVTEDQLIPALKTQNQQIENLSRLSSEKLAKALQVGFVINSTIDLEEVLNLIMKYANIVTDAVASTLMLLDEKTGELVFSVPTGPNAEHLKDVRIPPGAGVAGWVAEKQTYLLVPDTRKDARFYPRIDDMTGMETRSLLCVPMKSKRKLIGVLEVMNKKDNSFFTEDDALILSVFSHHAAIAIENAMLFNSMKNRLEREKMIEQKMAESARLQAIGTLAGGIAHDFNNILSAIMGYTELARMDSDKLSRPYANLTKILAASERARDLIHQILAFSRQVEVAKPRPVQVNIIVKEALKLLQASFPKTIRMVEDLSCSSTIMGDATQIHQVVMNLCTNAAQAMKEKQNGVLTVKLEPVTLPAPCEKNQTVLPSGSYLKLEVADTGNGMPSHVMERIFEPFFTTKPKGQGTGMGLSVVHGIVKKHGGDIQVQTTPGEGSIFQVFFPVAQQGGQPAVEKKNPQKLPRGTEHILVVDDDIMLLDVTKRGLNSLGYHVTIETSSLEAIRKFKAHPDEYDLVITDMSMPEMDGDEMCLAMRAIRSDIPMIMCTGFSAQMTEHIAQKKGFEAFLMKPVQLGDLARVVRRILDTEPKAV